MRLILFAFIFFLLIFSSCNGKDEDIPSYIQIDTVEVSINNESKEGSNNHNINDVWVYINDIYQGNYEIPAKFPVLNSGKNKITLKAGIKLNGISSTREEYEFYNYIDIDTNLTPKTILKLTPKFSYKSNASFWIEDFNDADIKIGSPEQYVTDTTIQQIENPDNSNDLIGAIYVNAERKKFIGATNMDTDPIYYNDANRRLMLELQYKNNQRFQVSLLTENKKIDVEFILPSSNWNTIYIDLTPAIKSNPNEKYSLAFVTIYEGNKQGEVFLNNIKLVKYE